MQPRIPDNTRIVTASIFVLIKRPTAKMFTKIANGVPSEVLMKLNPAAAIIPRTTGFSLEIILRTTLFSECLR